MNRYEAYIINIEKRSRRPYLRNMTHPDSIFALKNMRYARRDFIDSMKFNPLLCLLGTSEYIKEYKKQKSMGNAAFKVISLPLP